MKLKYFISLIIVVVTPSLSSFAQYRDDVKDTLVEAHKSDSAAYFPHTIPNLLPENLFIPRKAYQGATVWMSAPITRPVVHVMPVYGFNGYGFGKFYVDHWEKFFANLLVFNRINVPSLVESQQMMIGNTIALGKKRRLYLANGILYGRYYGTWGNMLGMGSREGLIFRPNGYVILAVWTQEYQSVYAYSPVLYARPGESTSAIKLPASPVVVSYGAQAYFLAGQFWIGIGAEFWNVADPKKH